MDNLKTKGGTIFNVERPSFKLGTSKVKNIGKVSNVSSVNNRGGLGNYDITRRSFTSPPIKPRMAGDFDKLQAIDIETQGTKIQLSEKTIAELFRTKVPDKTDIQWITERNRLLAYYRTRGMSDDEIERELQVNKPLGREQRKVIATQNIAQSQLTLADKLTEIKQEVLEGRAESRAQQALLIGQLALIFRDTQALDNFTQTQLADLSQTLNRINLPRTAKQMGLNQRYIDIQYYNANVGMINLYLFGNASYDPNFSTTDRPNTNISYSYPVYNFVASQNGFPCMKLTSLVSAMSRQRSARTFLDLEQRGMISFNEMDVIQDQLDGGWDNPQISIEQGNRLR